MSLTRKDGKWYWKNWLGLMQSPYFDTEAEAKEWKEKFHDNIAHRSTHLQ